MIIITMVDNGQNHTSVNHNIVIGHAKRLNKDSVGTVSYIEATRTINQGR